MIQATELRLNNLIYDNFGRVCKVESIGLFNNVRLTGHDFTCESKLLEDCNPIKLTPEFFENNEYKRGSVNKRHGNGYDYQPKNVFTEWFDFYISEYITYRFQNWHYDGGIDNEDCLIWHDNEIRGCEFVHDFQNLFFILAGEDFKLI